MGVMRRPDRSDRDGPAITAAVVADRWPLMRVGLAKAVSLAGLRLAGEARTLPEALTVARERSAGLVLLGDTDDMTIPALRRLNGTPLVVTLVRRATQDDLTELLGAGVAGVGLRSVAPDELAALVARALAGERAVAQALLPTLVGWSAAETTAAISGGGALPAGPGPRVASPQAVPPAGTVSGADGGAGLTAKEREVLSALAAGASNQQIASQLFVTPATVKTHLAHIYAKLGVRSRHEALSRAVALGLVH